jgi:phosphoribosyl-AMP cyclohydrolase
MNMAKYKPIGPENLIDNIKFDAHGLIPAIIQDKGSGKVITLCYLNLEAIKKSLAEGKVYLFRRSQNRLMLKGETSGHIQIIREIFIDCEGKSLLIKVKQKTAGCHAGYFSCYFRKLAKSGKISISQKRVFEPDKVYKK